MTSLVLDSALVQGYLAEDPEAIALVAFVAANGDDRALSESHSSASQAAQYIAALPETESRGSRTLVFEIDARDPDTEECHSFSTDDEAAWRAMYATMLRAEWEAIQPSIQVVVGSIGGPTGYRTRSPHIRAA